MEDRRFSLWFSVFFAAMAALRLARYSSHPSDPEEAHLWFEGLPTPGAAAVIAGLAVLLDEPAWRPAPAVLRMLPLATLALGILMVSKFPYVHFMNRFLKGRKPHTYLVIAILVVVLSLAWNFWAVAAGAVAAYALSGPVVWIFRRGRGRPARAGAGSPAGTEGKG
jgi:CDP-diacylglycerol--serine O-phosphatidyltransferase